MTNYIGLDGHSKTCTFVTLNQAGVEISQVKVQTNEREIKSYLRSLTGKKILTFEESSLSRWLYMVTKDEVDELVVCNPVLITKKQGAKTDYIDGRHLACELRAGNLVPVYHDETPLFALRSIVSAYLKITREIVENKCRLKSLFIAQAIKVDGKTIFADPKRIQELPSPADQMIADALMFTIQNLDAVKAQYQEVLKQNVKIHPMIKKLTSVPGIDFTRANIIAAIICDGKRFPSKHELWSYARLVRHKQMSDGRCYGSKKSMGRSDLKNVFMGIADSNLFCDLPLKKYYERLRSKGIDHVKAKKGLARYAAAICLQIMKTGRPYDVHYEEKKLREKNRAS